MNPRTSLFCIFLISVFTGNAQNLTVYKSEKNVEETSSMVVEVIRQKGLIFFELVNHDQIAAERGLQINPTRSILFEDPELTTALIACQQTTAIDLPLEILVWEENDEVFIGYIDPQFMVKRFMIRGCDNTIKSLTRLMLRVAMDANRLLQESN